MRSYGTEALAAVGALYAFWCRTPSRPNFGDALAPWMIRRLTGTHPRFARPADPVLKHFVGGSIIAYAGRDTVVWGSGIMYRRDYISQEASLIAVRGPLTRQRAIECGASCPEVLGDPALLLPRIYPSASACRRGIGLIPHFADAPRLPAARNLDPDVRLIDIQDPVEAVIDQVTSCELVASSSLHGLIVGHAYGIPAAWIKFGDLPSGDDSKFIDYLASVGYPDHQPLMVECHRIQSDDLSRHAIPPTGALDLEPLWQSCPFRVGDLNGEVTSGP